MKICKNIPLPINMQIKFYIIILAVAQNKLQLNYFFLQSVSNNMQMC